MGGGDADKGCVEDGGEAGGVFFVDGMRTTGGLFRVQGSCRSDFLPSDFGFGGKLAEKVFSEGENTWVELLEDGVLDGIGYCFRWS